ncbi:MAG: hypothetical protein IT364_03710 [Candidatus Hydrogenedentes bacterium]|nr:hypothetical protein [Candidatus Hydrogenedentota bacterium]
MAQDMAQILSHIPNSGIVQLPGRRFPGVTLQGDSLSILFDYAAFCVREFKRLRQEDAYFEALQLAETLQEHLIHYEETLRQRGGELPYTVSVYERLVEEDHNI